MNDADFQGILPEMLPRLWSWALRLTSDTHDAEDLVQKTCVRALERAEQLQTLTSPLSWLYSILYSTWVNELRARKVRTRRTSHIDDDVLNNLADPTAGSPEEILMNAQIVRAVMRLPEGQRLVMLLVAVEGLSYSEAAESLGVPIGTIMSRLSRARKTIGATLIKDANTPGGRQSKIWK